LFAQRQAPYVVNIDNTNTSVDATDIVIFNTSNALWNAAPSYQPVPNPDIVISMGYADATYRDMLNATSSIPFVVGLTLIQGINLGVLNNAQAQVSATISMAERLASGQGSGVPLTFYPDIYQPQTNILACRTTYKIDTFFKMTIGRLYAATRCQLTFFPERSASLARMLGR
jgi:hypothetical protein